LVTALVEKEVVIHKHPHLVTAKR